MQPSHAPLLEVDGISLRFGGVHALKDISFTVGEREICGIIGPNGAGKTSLFNCLSRIYDPSSGRIRFAGRDLGKAEPHQMARAGIARTFQNVALFDRMSVRQNVLAGCFGSLAPHLGGSLWHTPRWRAAERQARAEVDALMQRMRLDSVAETLASELSFGTRKRVELARALAMRPRLLLLDEPAAGLNHEEVGELESWIREIRDTGVSVLLIEHHMNLVMRVSDHVVVLNFGAKIADGESAQVAANPEVVSAYLGSDA
jgi:branched-chain amino acid transport system ATP-binding protein